MTFTRIKWRGRVRGVYDHSSRTYFRRATTAHYCYKHRGWGIQADIIEELHDLRCRKVVIDVAADDGPYRLSIDFEQYGAHGIRDILREADGEQVFVPEDHFSRDGRPAPVRRTPPQRTRVPPAARPPRPEVTSQRIDGNTTLDQFGG